MINNLNRFMEMLQKGGNRPNNKTNVAVKIFREEIKQELDSIIPKDSYYKTSASTGQHSTVMAEVSWYAIFDKRFITKASGSFYYVVYLFRANGEGFYLSLNQSWTNIKEIKIYDDTDQLIDSKIIAAKSAEILADKIDPLFLSKCITTKINLDAHNDFGVGYECANIAAKYYEFGKFTDEQLKDDLLEMLKVYSSLVQIVDLKQYQSLFSRYKGWISESISIDNKKVEENNEKSIVYSEITSNYRENFGENILSEVSDNCTISDDELQKRLTRNRDVGYRSEELALEYYRNETRRIVGENNFFDYEQKIVNLGRNHGHGYDIKALDLNDLESGKMTEIHVEVKATESIRGTESFFMTRNELNQAINDKEIYRILRIYDFKSKNPKFDELNLFKNIDESDKLKTIDEIVEPFLNIVPGSYIIKGWKKE